MSDDWSVTQKDARSNRIVAVGLLTQADLDQLGAGFDRAFPVDPAPTFEELLQAIDDADRELRITADRHGPQDHMSH